MSEDLPFEKKGLLITVHNPNNLPVIDFHELKELQGDLKISTPAKIEKIKSSIRKYGIFVPKFTWIDNGTYYIEDGHQTIKALIELEKGGYTVPPIPYVEILAEDRKDAGEKLLMIDSRFADINPETSFFKDFDIELEFMEEIEIPELELDFEGVGEEIVEDEVPEVPEDPITQVGDLWLCGGSRVLCGDATKAEDVERLMDGKKADACLTDPPYGVAANYGTFQDTPENAKILIEEIMPFILTLPCAAITSGIPAMFFYPKPSWGGTWVHPAPSGSCPWGFVGNNPILFYGGDPYLKAGMGRHPDSIVMAADREGINGHPTPNPLKVWTWLVERLTIKQRQIVFDPFLGSGTAIIAAHQLNRICYGMEIAPKYVDVICQRFFNLTGIDPVRESDGKNWSELQQEKIDKT